MTVRASGQIARGALAPLAGVGEPSHVALRGPRRETEQSAAPAPGGGSAEANRTASKPSALASSVIRSFQRLRHDLFDLMSLARSSEIEIGISP